MSLADHAKHELELAGIFDSDSDYGGEVGKDVMALVELFASQGHSCGSAGITLQLFCLVANYRPLTDLTDSKHEWNDVAEISGYAPGTMWQSNRRPDAFSKDGGRTYYLLDKPNEFLATAHSNKA